MGHRFDSVGVETLADDRTITQAEADETHFWSFDPGGAGRTVTLPAEADNAGNWLFIANAADGAEVLTIEDDGTSTVATPTQAEAVMVFCDGTSWFGLVGASS